MTKSKPQNMQSLNMLGWRIRQNQAQKLQESVRRQLLEQQHAPLKAAR